MASFRARLLAGVLRIAGMRRRFADPSPSREGFEARREVPALPGRALRRRLRVERSVFQDRNVYTVCADRTGSGPVVLYLHGGAFVYPITVHHWRFIGRMAERLGATFLVPFYPLAPESTCREATAFALAAYRDLVERVDPGRVFLMGDSAGGGLALSTAMLAARSGVPAAAGLVLISPWLDVSVSDPAQAAIEPRDPMLMRPGLRAAGRWYAGELPLEDPLASPLFGSMDGVPPTLLFCGTHDILVCDARRLAAKARRENRNLVFEEEPGLMHVYAILPLPEGDAARRRIERFVREASQSRPRKPS